MVVEAPSIHCYWSGEASLVLNTPIVLTEDEMALEIAVRYLLASGNEAVSVMDSFA